VFYNRFTTVRGTIAVLRPYRGMLSSSDAERKVQKKGDIFRASFKGGRVGKTKWLRRRMAKRLVISSM
jgi:hypothetical protein